MRLSLKPGRTFWQLTAVVVLVHLLAVGLFWETFGDKVMGLTAQIPHREAIGIYQGKLPPPVEPSIVGEVRKMLAPEPQYQLMTIRHIPPVEPGTPMPHPYVGDCNHCHLFVGGAPPGSQPITPVGVILEEMSKVKKVGPPILPTSDRPHPAAGRCIKCHDIVIKAPVERQPGGFAWTL